MQLGFPDTAIPPFRHYPLRQAQVAHTLFLDHLLDQSKKRQRNVGRRIQEENGLQVPRIRMNSLDRWDSADLVDEFVDDTNGTRNDQAC